MQPTGLIITFTCVAASMIIVRSANLKTAADQPTGMSGLHGIGCSQLAGSDVIGGTKVAFWIAVLAFIALVCMNDLQLLSL
jgi:hypothetical protein